MCGQREDAEEVAQETLLKVFESFNQLREPARVRPWVFQIAPQRVPDDEAQECVRAIERVIARRFDAGYRPFGRPFETADCRLVRIAGPPDAAIGNATGSRSRHPRVA